MSGKLSFFLVIFAVCFMFRDMIFDAVSPFLFAFLIALPVKRLAKRASEKTKVPHKLCGVLILIFTLMVLFFLLKACILKLAGELSLLSEKISQEPDLLLDFFEEFKAKLSSGRGFLSRFFKKHGFGEISESIEAHISEIFSKLVSSLGEKISSAAINTAKKIPSALIFLLVFFMSCFYFVCDDGKILSYFSSLMSKETNKALSHFLLRTKKLVVRYFGASFLLCGITFFIVFIGLVSIRAKYALLLSLLAALVDLLPLLGAGCILVPWSVACLLGGDFKTGIALLIIFAVVTIVRQIAEPKILGKNIGLHPLATLFSVYVGGELLGFIGLFLGPLIAVGIKGILQSKSIDNKDLI